MHKKDFWLQHIWTEEKNYLPISGMQYIDYNMVHGKKKKKHKNQRCSQFVLRLFACSIIIVYHKQ